MNAADITKLVSKLRFKVQPRRKFPTKFGPMGRLNKLSDYVTAMIKYERIEMYYPRADETRGYVERVRTFVCCICIPPHWNSIDRITKLSCSFFFIPSSFQLISEAVRHGDQHAPTMAMADFWIKDKQYIHKLFKVIVPRLQNCPIAYTKMYKVPITYPDLAYRQRAILELRGNPFPALKPELGVNRNFIHNVLLEEAKKEYRRKKYAQLSAESVAASESTKSSDIEQITKQMNDTNIEEKADSDAGDTKTNDAKESTVQSKPAKWGGKMYRRFTIWFTIKKTLFY